MSLSRSQEKISARSPAIGGAGRAASRQMGGRTTRWFFGPIWLLAAGAAIFLTRGEPAPAPPPPVTPTIWIPDVTPVGTPSVREADVGRGPGGTLRGRRPPSSGGRYRFQRLVSVGQPAPGGGFHGGSFEIDGLNRAGQAVVGSDLENPWGRGEALYLLAPNRETRIAAPGEAAPGGRRYGTVIWMPPGINAHAQVVWAGQMESGEAWLLTYDARTGRTAVVERPGMPAPGGGAFQSQGRQRIVINNTGDIAFDGYVPGTRGVVPGVFVVSNGEMQVVAREGTPAPNGGAFQIAETPAINDAREIVFQGAVTGDQWLGVYLWQEGFISPVATPGTRVRSSGSGLWALGSGLRNGAARRTRALRGSRSAPHPDLEPRAQSPEPGARATTVTLQAAFHPQIDGYGRVVFVGRTERGDGLYRWSRGKIVPILETGDPVPGVGRLDQIHFHRRRPFFLNARGDVAFSGEAGGRGVVFVWSRGATHVVARADEYLPGVGRLTQVGSPDSGYSYPYPPAGAAGFSPGYRPPGTNAPPYGYLPPTGFATGPGPGYLPVPRMTGPPGADRRRSETARGREGEGARGRGGESAMARWRDGATPVPSPRRPVAPSPPRRPPTLRAGTRTGGGQRSVRDRAPRQAWSSAIRSPGMGPYGMPGGGPYGGYFGQPFGLVLSDDGKLLLPAMVDGRPCVVLATPRSGGRQVASRAR